MINEDWDIVINSSTKKKKYWSEIWSFRELFYVLSWRDIKVRYKQTFLGVMWSVIRPLLTAIIFTLVFKKIANLNYTNDAPYVLMVMVGMLPWQFFSSAISESSSSLIGNSNLITKIYFPRIIIPASSIITCLVDFLISCVVLAFMFLGYQFVPSWHIVFLPIAILFVFMLAFGCGLWLTSSNVKYRDFRYVIPFLLQLGLYISPVGFNSSIIAEKWEMLFALNPLVGIIELFRWCIIGEPIHLFSLSMAFIFTGFMFFVGLKSFRKMEKHFADHI